MNRSESAIRFKVRCLSVALRQLYNTTQESGRILKVGKRDVGTHLVIRYSR